MNIRQIILQLEENNPNEEGGVYQQAISVLYAVAYTLKMSYKTNHKIEGFDYSKTFL